jgi:hypothetical protein
MQNLIKYRSMEERRLSCADILVKLGIEILKDEKVVAVALSRNDCIQFMPPLCTKPGNICKEEKNEVR